jgi:uncharacterized protein YjbI with pentapeptide repeats
MRRTLFDVAVVEERLIASGRDGANPLIAISDDRGRNWRAVEVGKPTWAEVATVNALAERDGVLVGVGSGGFGCPDPVSLCSDFLGAVWRSTDRGETWEVVAAPAMSPAPESSVVDVAAGPDGFVAIGNVYGPAAESALLWTSSDGLAWSEGIGLPPTAGGFPRGSQVVRAGPTVVAGHEVLCGRWYDNGFWVFNAGFVTQARMWVLAGGELTPLDLTKVGLPVPQAPECPEEGPIIDPESYESHLGELGVAGGRPAVAVPGQGLASVDDGGELVLEGFDLLEEESLHFVAGDDTVLGIRPGLRSLLEARSWTHDSKWIAQAEGPPIPTGGSTSLGTVVAIGEDLVGVGLRTAGITEGVIWLSSPGSVVETAGLTCDPGPGADCRGVDLGGEDLSGLDLTGIDFRHADLSGADLSEADLSGARFGSAELWSVNLAGATLQGADLAGVRLTSFGDDRVELAKADFTGADLRGATVDLTGPAVFDEIVADGAYFNVSGAVAGISFRRAGLARAFITKAYDAAFASLEADFAGADLTLAYLDLDTSGSSFVGVADEDVNFGDGATCPDGSKPVNQAYGINRCSLG